ncbi:MAG: holo-ACP synthase [Rhodobacteraceae bacterium]|nr:holo-ACP synthase [Paracoccaceae bacterium]
MILGIGTDMARSERIATTLARFGDRFRHRAFTAAEQAHARARGDEAAALAKRWAAKEACAKALGTGIGHRAGLAEIEVVRAPSGLPRLHLHGHAAARLAEMVPPGHTPALHLSLSDEGGLALAFVVIEARPLPTRMAPGEGPGHRPARA